MTSDGSGARQPSYLGSCFDGAKRPREVGTALANDLGGCAQWSALPGDAMKNNQTTLGELISLVYREYLSLYGDSEVASVATAATINQLLEAEKEAANTPIWTRACAA
jgi:hypothetical protein